MYSQDFADAPFDFSSSTQPERSDKPNALSVTSAIKRANAVMVEHTFVIIGEVSELNNKSGYKAVYFSIKDETSTLNCKMWKNRFDQSGVQLDLGSKVVVTGKFEIFNRTGRMTLDVLKITLAGDGLLRQQVAQLANRLKAEGLMDPARKRPLPYAPQTIGLVTSPRGAAVHDVLRTLRRRYPMARVLFAGVPVEGKNAPADLSNALCCVADGGAEVVLLVRGGGSFEDLMPFNDEGLARTIAALPIPVITGIGHEPDTSIADMVSDVRASTPTHAAQVACPDMVELHESIANMGSRATYALNHRLQRSAQYIDAIASRPLFKDPSLLYASDAQTLDMQLQRFERLQTSLLNRYKNDAALLTSRLHDLSPLHTLERGWSIVSDEDGKVVSSIEAVKPNDRLRVRMSDGAIWCRAESEIDPEITQIVSMEE